jgi:hypothetical protein
MKTATHKCPGHECQEQVAAGKLMCAAHWGEVPPQLQAEVYEAWDRGRGRGSLRHLAAVQAAVEAVRP